MTADDVDAVHRHWNAELVRRFLWDDQPVALETVRAVLAASSADFARAGYGMWVLRDEAPGIVGLCGLRPIDGSDDVEVLYSIEPARWGRGLATEAARAVLTCAFARLGLTRILGGVDEPNVASRRVLEKLGMRPAAQPSGGPSGVHYLAVDRERFLATSA
jgi:RimJ/RimL family protein N-acetyltransferase